MNGEGEGGDNDEVLLIGWIGKPACTMRSARIHTTPQFTLFQQQLAHGLQLGGRHLLPQGQDYSFPPAVKQPTDAGGRLGHEQDCRAGYGSLCPLLRKKRKLGRTRARTEHPHMSTSIFRACHEVLLLRNLAPRRSKLQSSSQRAAKSESSLRQLISVRALGTMRYTRPPRQLPSPQIGDFKLKKTPWATFHVQHLQRTLQGPASRASRVSVATASTSRGGFHRDRRITTAKPRRPSSTLSTGVAQQPDFER